MEKLVQLKLIRKGVRMLDRYAGAKLDNIDMIVY